MKTNKEELKIKVDVCVDYLESALSKGTNEFDNLAVLKDFSSLSQIIVQMSTHLSEFNFYPSDIPGHCCQVSFFLSLNGKHWNLKNSEKVSFDQKIICFETSVHCLAALLEI